MPPMLELAGEIADGVILNFMPVEAVPRMLEHVRRGAGRAGRDASQLESASRVQTVGAGGTASGLTCRIMRRGAEHARTSDPQANTGQWIDIVRHVADMLAACGEHLRAGELIITGSVVPPLVIEPDETGMAFALDPVGDISVRFQ
mgnify:CR=1 FL=1